MNMALLKHMLGKFSSSNKTSSQTNKILKHMDNIQVIFERENLFEYCKRTLTIIRAREENNDFYEDSKKISDCQCLHQE